ncbi:MAG: hypothetical protein KDB74_07945 [Flavobacteriales bacterium]|nr:hypothetical protein [Flavobacteriales bacterium]
MKHILIAFFTVLISLSIYSQDILEFEFDKARVLLAQRKIDEAFLSLNKLYQSNPENGNYNFLMGAAFAESMGKSAEAVFHLKKAIKYVSEDYTVGNFQETDAPIHAYYYLTLAFVQQDRCEEAYLALAKLKTFKTRLDKYYIEEAERHLMKCPFEPNETVEKNWNKIEPAPAGYDPTYVPEEVFLDSTALAERGIFVKEQVYSTKAPLYGVQIGANINPSPISNYGSIKNVDVFIDTKGIIRYVVGHYSIRSQAETLLKTLQEQGYKDAFIVNVNDERKYHNELISFNNVNVKAGIKGKVEFYLQLGAFEQVVPDSIKSLYQNIPQLIELDYKSHTLLLVGPTESYEKALAIKKEVDALNVSKPFIVAFNNRKKIPLQTAINHTKH